MTGADEDRPGARARFAPGDVLAGRYRIVALIGDGAIGEVYEAYDSALGEPVALKTLKAAVASHAITIERFRREIQLARHVTHRNVCRTYDLGRHELGDGSTVTFITMELLRGSTLADRLDTGERMSTAEALPLVAQIVAGLDAAHRAGVVHRDLKPGNLMLVPSDAAEASHAGEPRLIITDFGVARRYADDEQTITHTGEAIGTPLYMAPEQVVSGSEQMTPATDVYALGIVMYEMVTGQLPFTGESTVVMALKRFREAAPSPRLLVPDLDANWEAAILRCLEREPARRFQRITEVLAAVRGEGMPPLPPPAEPEGRGGLRGWWRRTFGGG